MARFRSQADSTVGHCPGHIVGHALRSGAPHLAQRWPGPTASFKGHLANDDRLLLQPGARLSGHHRPAPCLPVATASASGGVGGGPLPDRQVNGIGPSGHVAGTTRLIPIKSLVAVRRNQNTRPITGLVSRWFGVVLS
jgi:hypothetical protein